MESYCSFNKIVIIQQFKKNKIIITQTICRFDLKVMQMVKTKFNYISMSNKISHIFIQRKC